jgi:type IV pilus assembly protein PilB
MAVETYLAKCWNCLGEFDALGAVWCSDDPKSPTKLCPFCFRCFCAASEKYKQEFWRHAPPRLLEELQTLNKSRDRLGDILVRMKRITIPQLLEALGDQKKTNRKLGELLIERGLVTSQDVEAALKTQGLSPLMDTRGVAYAASPVWDQSEPQAIIQYLLNLAARKGASDVQLEPKEDAIAVKFRIDGFFFRVDPIPKHFQNRLTQRLFEYFRLDLSQTHRPQAGRVRDQLGDGQYDLSVQTLPTTQGVGATIKLVDRATFLKDFETLGLELEDRVRLMEQLRNSFGLVLVSAPAFNGAITTTYSIMSFLAHAQRDVVALESPLHWPMDGVRQYEVESEGGVLKMEAALRTAMGVRPEALVLSAVPDAATAQMVAQLATSILVVAVTPGQNAGHSVTNFLARGAPRDLVVESLAVVTCQRLVRQVCRICRLPAEPPAAQTLSHHGILPEEATTLRFFKGRGCPTCNKVGYRGRRAVFEVLTGAREVRAAVQSGLPAADIELMAIGAGMRTMRDHCLDLVREGVTTFDEYVRLGF